MCCNSARVHAFEVLPCLAANALHAIAWMPDTAPAGAERQTKGCLPAGGKARVWARPWRLQARVVHAWRAHREGMHACAAAPSEDFVVSAGRAASSGREADVLRVWDLATSTAGRKALWESLLRESKSLRSRWFTLTFY